MISSRRVGGLGVGGTYEGDQKQASNEARSKSGGTREKFTSYGNLGPPPASGGQSQLAACSEELSAASTVAGRTEMAGRGRVVSIEHPGEPG